MCSPALCKTRSQARLGGPRRTPPLHSSPGDHIPTGCCSGFASFPVHTDVIPQMLVNLVVRLPPTLHPEAAFIICRGQTSLDLLRPRKENGEGRGLADPLLAAKRHAGQPAARSFYWGSGWVGAGDTHLGCVFSSCAGGVPLSQLPPGCNRVGSRTEAALCCSLQGSSTR